MGSADCRPREKEQAAPVRKGGSQKGDHEKVIVSSRYIRFQYFTARVSNPRIVDCLDLRMPFRNSKPENVGYFVILSFQDDLLMSAFQVAQKWPYFATPLSRSPLSINHCIVVLWKHRTSCGKLCTISFPCCDSGDVCSLPLEFCYNVCSLPLEFCYNVDSGVAQNISISIDIESMAKPHRTASAGVRAHSTLRTMAAAFFPNGVPFGNGHRNGTPVGKGHAFESESHFNRLQNRSPVRRKRIIESERARKHIKQMRPY